MKKQYTRVALLAAIPILLQSCQSEEDKLKARVEEAVAVEEILAERRAAAFKEAADSRIAALKEAADDKAEKVASAKEEHTFWRCHDIKNEYTDKPLRMVSIVTSDGWEKVPVGNTPWERINVRVDPKDGFVKRVDIIYDRMYTLKKNMKDKSGKIMDHKDWYQTITIVSDGISKSFRVVKGDIKNAVKITDTAAFMKHIVGASSLKLVLKNYNDETHIYRFRSSKFRKSELSEKYFNMLKNIKE